MQPNPSVASFLNIAPLFLVFLVFYFLIIKPQKKKEAEHKKTIAALKKNDEVVTAGGMHGVIVGVKDETFTLRIDDTTNAKVEVDKNSISYVTKKSN